MDEQADGTPQHELFFLQPQGMQLSWLRFYFLIVSTNPANSICFSAVSQNTTTFFIGKVEVSAGWIVKISSLFLKSF